MMIRVKDIATFHDWKKHTIDNDFLCSALSPLNHPSWCLDSNKHDPIVFQTVEQNEENNHVQLRCVQTLPVYLFQSQIWQSDTPIKMPYPSNIRWTHQISLTTCLDCQIWVNKENLSKNSLILNFRGYGRLTQFFFFMFFFFLWIDCQKVFR